MSTTPEALTLAAGWDDYAAGDDYQRPAEQTAAELRRLAAVEAERDQLRTDLANALARDVHSCHDGCTRAGCVNARLRAEVEALRADAERWQPIETAPKDGTHILLANQAGTSEGGWLSDVDHGADWEGQIGMAGWWRTDGTDWPNTHWQPLPAPPAA